MDGTLDRIRAMNARVSTLAAAEGHDNDFERYQMINAFDAHWVVHLGKSPRRGRRNPGVRIPVKAISQSGVFDHPRSEAAKRPTRGLGSLPDDHLLSMCCG